jgi:DNA-binding PadR family transcriptional regulator
MALDAGRELLILGILRRGPLSAYDITRAVKMHGSLYRALARGNIYEQLAQLEKSGAVLARTEAAARGPRKTKTVYQLTASGRRRFDSVIAAVFNDPQIPDPTLEVACVLLGQFSRERARAFLTQRLAALTAHQKRLVRLYGKPEERGGAALLAMTHATNKVEADITWTKNSLANLRNVKWKPEWVSDDEATAQSRRLP